MFGISLYSRLAIALFVLGAGMTTVLGQPKVSSGTIERIEKFQSKYVDPRTVDVWLPDGYSKKKKYAVLYMHDGQMLFDAATTWNKQEWRVDEVLGSMIADGRVRDTIVVAIWNNGELRHSEYYAAKTLSLLKPDIKTTVEQRYLKGSGRADDYLRFLVSELKPFVDNKYSTLRDRANTFTMGASMGGVISIYALCEYPSVFGGAAGLSTHWPLVAADGTGMAIADDAAAAFRTYLRKDLPPADSRKIYLDYGDQTLDAFYPPHQKLVDQIMKERGYSDKMWMTRAFPGEDHSEKAWAKRLDIPLEFLLRKKGK